MGNTTTLKQLAAELTDKLRKGTFEGWQVCENARSLINGLRNRFKLVDKTQTTQGVSGRDQRASIVGHTIKLGGWRDPKKWPAIQEATTDAMVRLEKAFKTAITALHIS